MYATIFSLILGLWCVKTVFRYLCNNILFSDLFNEDKFVCGNLIVRALFRNHLTNNIVINY